MKSPRQVVCLCFVVSASVWFGLGATRLWDRDEPRNARCAVEMIERNDWIVPMFNGELRTHKPILLYWLQMASIASFGQTEFAARFGGALMASLTILAIYRFGARNVDDSFGFRSAAALSTSLMFVVAARAATPDACLIAMGTIGILALVQHWLSGEPHFTKYAWLGYFGLGLAILAKGPVGLVLPLMVVGLWSLTQAWADRETRISIASENRSKIFVVFLFELAVVARSTIRRLHLFRGLSIAVAVALPWYLWVGLRTDGEWLYGFFVEHNLHRAVSTMEGHRGGWWFYPAASLVGLFPWSLLLVPIGMWTAGHFRRTEFSPMVKLGLIWLSTYIVVFSLAKTKLPSYITPGYPGAALLIGGFLSQWRIGQLVLSKLWLAAGAMVFFVVGTSIAGGLYYASVSGALPNMASHAIWSIGLVLVGVALVSTILRGRQDRMPNFILAASVLFLAGMFGFAAPELSRHREDLETVLRHKDFTNEVGSSESTRWCSVRAIEPSWVYYLGTTIHEYAMNGDIGDSDFIRRNEGDLQAVFSVVNVPSGRLVVTASEIERWRGLFAEKFNLSLSTATEFSAFLKDDRIAILKSDPSIAVRSAAEPDSGMNVVDR